MRTNQLFIAAFVVGATVSARADLIQTFAGFDTYSEIGVSGLRSSYDADTRAGHPFSGSTVSSALPIFATQHVSYPSGVGEVPSPGGSVGRYFDQGMLGVKVDDGHLVIRLASGLNPQTGYYYDGWQAWYGEGDMFVDVSDPAGIRHYALLNSWARDAGGTPRSLNGGNFNAARDFHVSGGAGSTSLEGHLVRVNADANISVTGGTGSYTSSNAPAGLDLRAYAKGGSDLGSAGLTQSVLSDRGQNWYIQTWTIDLGSLSDAAAYNIGLHASASCGNDQIGGTFSIPEPSSLGLVLSGAALLPILRRRG